MEENFNIHLGKKLRMRRLSLGLTQTKVAQAINVTFQQIQKYEKGTNGVSSNRLMQLSQFLKVPIIYFFEDFKEFKDVNSDEMNNDDLAKQIAKQMGVEIDLSYTDFSVARPGHDRRYSLDGTKLHDMGWRPPVDFDTALQRTIDWMKGEIK